MFLITVLLVIVSFYVGAVVGIRDCKKKYNIPKGEQPPTIHNDIEVNENGDVEFRDTAAD